MKKITLLLASLLCVLNLFAQGTETTQKHSSQTVKQLNFGIIGASFEFPVHRNITIAPAVGTDFNLNWLALGAKGNFYFDNLFDLPSDWDVYAGANAGFATALGNNSKSDDFNVGLHVGGRWFWNDKWGVYLEFGGGNTLKGTGGIGITMKL